ncbi:MAG: transglycosylase SLT domain-containing protein [Bacteroidota bacterium]|nr:transglycosylase SLT domain-containing protein [Bacteroidota bacterium]
MIFWSTDVPYNKSYDPVPQKIHAVNLLEQYEFAGEDLPMNNFDVVERLERELLINTYQHTSTLIHLKLSARYFPTVERIFKECGIPDDFKYLAVAESSLRNAISPAGAKGIWQFRDAAATELGLEINEYVDERYHFEKATFAACQYLKKQKERFGNWTLAAAAYNMGPNGLQNAMNEQKEEIYFNLNLSDETNRYLFRILAAKEVMKEPEKFGFFVHSKDKYEPFEDYKLVEINTSIESLADFAHKHGCTYRLLKVYNPWLIKSSLSNKDAKSYQIKLPK